MTKYGYSFPSSVVKRDKQRLINQMWKLLPLREENKDWLKQLNNVIIEINGLQEVFKTKVNFLILLSKLEGLKTIEDFTAYRRTVFETISLFGELYEE
jgi:hypothetical protein